MFRTLEYLLLSILLIDFFQNVAGEGSNKCGLTANDDIDCDLSTKNDYTFKYLGQKGRGCGWVANFPADRCCLDGVKAACQQSCCRYDGPPTSIPTANDGPPTLSPTASPTRACEVGLKNDWTFKYQGQRGRGCSWVDSDPDERCNLDGVKDACVKACCHIDFTTASPTTMEPTTTATTKTPTMQPTTTSPTGAPTMAPTATATTEAPTMAPTATATTKAPTMAPTVAATTEAPTMAPTVTATTKAPTMAPTATATTEAPTMAPTATATTEAPTMAPTVAATTEAPTYSPTAGPTRACEVGLKNDWTFRYEDRKGRGCGWVDSDPDDRCYLTGVKDACAKYCCHIDTTTALPTSSPLAAFSNGPTNMPTRSPFAAFSNGPTNMPTETPPSGTLSRAPSGEPSDVPSRIPTSSPTSTPSGEPTDMPSLPPSGAPSRAPSGEPSSKPSAAPFNKPSKAPSAEPSASPTMAPTDAPTVSAPPTTVTAPPTMSTEPPVPDPTEPPVPDPTEPPTMEPTTPVTNGLVLYPYYRYTPYFGLNAENTDAATTLSYERWEWEIPGTNEVELLDFDSLSLTQQEAAKTIGFPIETYAEWDGEYSDTWDCYVNHYSNFYWSTLEGYGIAQYWEVLGYTERIWNGNDPSPPAADLYWDGLSDDEKEAADMLCYFEYTWDMTDDISNWPLDYQGEPQVVAY